MRIALVSREYPPFFGGGIATYIIQASRALAEAGHDVHVFTVGHEESVEQGGNVTVHRSRFALPDEFENKMAWGWSKFNENLHVADLLHRAVSAAGLFDVVEFPETETPALLALLDPDWKFPTVVDCHSPTWLLREANGLDRQRGQEFEKLQIALADEVCAPSKVTADRIKMDAGRELSVAPHPFYADDFCDRFELPTGNTVLFVGRLERLKGVVSLVDAAVMLLRQRPETKFVFAGSDTLTAPGGGSMKEHLLARIPEPMRPAFDFCGNVAPEKLHGLYCAARFCVFPSILDNFPNVCLEAMASGRTAVYGKHTGMAEMMAGSGIAADPDDIAGLERQMRRLLDDQMLCAELGQTAFNRIRTNYSPQKFAADRTRLYEKAIAKTGGASRIDVRVKRVPATTWVRTTPEMAVVMRILHGGSDHLVTESEKVGNRIIGALAHLEKPERIALYGAGNHTRKLAPQFQRLKEHGIHVEAILDDNSSRHGEQIGDVKILGPEQGARAVDAVVLSSDVAESMLWEKTEAMRNRGIEVVRLYAPKQNDRSGS